MAVSTERPVVKQEPLQLLCHRHRFQGQILTLPQSPPPPPPPESQSNRTPLSNLRGGAGGPPLRQAPPRGGGGEPEAEPQYRHRAAAIAQRLELIGFPLESPPWGKRVGGRVTWWVEGGGGELPGSKITKKWSKVECGGAICHQRGSNKLQIACHPQEAAGGGA